MNKEGYFNIRKDLELIGQGTHFWCEGCLVAKANEEQSLDSRYCKECYDILSDEAKLLSSTKSPRWKPKVSVDVPYNKHLKPQIRPVEK